MKISLESFEQEIEEREEEIRVLEKGIEKSKELKAEYIKKNCQYKEDGMCSYFNEELDDGNCSDCSLHLSINQIKR